MNEDLYDTGSAVVCLYKLFTNFFKFPMESFGGGGGGGGVYGLPKLTVANISKTYFCSLDALLSYGN